MPSVVDFAFVGLVAVITGCELVYLRTAFRKQIAAGVPNARRNAYRWEIAIQQGIAAIAIVLWTTAGRSWTALGLVPPHGWRLVIGAALVVLVAAFFARQLRAVRRLSEPRRAAVRKLLDSVESFLPHSRAERKWFALLSVTAGVCEELLFRGYLPWLLAAYIGLPGAIAIAVTAFGLAHAYQGAAGMLKAAAAGLVFTFVVLLTGWLIPAMIVHALIDLNSGEIAFIVLADRPASPLASAA